MTCAEVPLARVAAFALMAPRSICTSACHIVPHYLTSGQQRPCSPLTTRGRSWHESGIIGLVDIERLRWWQIEELLPIEADLFGDEAWTAAMFWNELANGHHYLVATEDDGSVL